MRFGCSSFSWETKDGLHLLGRTYDQFGDLSLNRVIRVPRGQGRYAYTGMAVLGFGEPFLVDGVNDAGLMGALLHYPEYAHYAPDADGGETVHPGRLLCVLLHRCATVAEAAQAMTGITLVDDMSQGSPLSAHYILSDRTGEAMILEPDEDGLRIHRQTVGVLTNSPDYRWQRTNLRAYVGVTNQHKPSQTIAGFELREFGERLGGCFGLPGDYSSPSRFVRLAFTKEFAVKGKDEPDGVSRMFRAFAPVDIPEGLLKADPQYEVYEQTLCTSVMCAESAVYYFAPAQNRRISAIRPFALSDGDIRYFSLGECQDIDYRTQESGHGK